MNDAPKNMMGGEAREGRQEPFGKLVPEVEMGDFFAKSMPDEEGAATEERPYGTLPDKHFPSMSDEERSNLSTRKRREGEEFVFGATDWDNGWAAERRAFADTIPDRPQVHQELVNIRDDRTREDAVAAPSPLQSRTRLVDHLERSTQLNFNHADLSGRDLQGLRMQNNESFQGANFSGAKLGKATFLGADFRGASFAEAELDCAVFTDCDLRGVDLTRVASSRYLELVNCKTDEKTKLPVGTRTR